MPKHPITPRGRVRAVLGKIAVGDGCWMWTGAWANSLYPRPVIRVDKKLRPATHVVYELLVGPVPTGLTLDHLCRERMCVRPDHLEPVTLRENIIRSMPYRHRVNGGRFRA